MSFDSVFHGPPTSNNGQAIPSGIATLGIDVTAGQLYYKTPNKAGWQPTGGGGASDAVITDPTADQTITGAHALLLNDSGSSLWVKSTASSGGIGIGSIRPGNNGFSGIDFIITDVWSAAVPGNYFYGFNENVSYAPAAAQAANIFGQFLTIGTSNSANANSTNVLGFGSNITSSAPASGSIIGYNAAVGTSASGGSPTFIFGVNLSASHSGTGSTIVQGHIIQSGAGGASATVSDNRSIFIKSPFVTGSITNHYGLYIDDQTVGGGNNPNPHAIKVIGGLCDLGPTGTLSGQLTLTAAAPVVAANQVGLGSTTAATASAGGGQAALASVLGYLVANVAGTTVKIPYFSA